MPPRERWRTSEENSLSINPPVCSKSTKQKRGRNVPALFLGCSPSSSALEEKLKSELDGARASRAQHRVHCRDVRGVTTAAKWAHGRIGRGSSTEATRPAPGI